MEVICVESAAFYSLFERIKKHLEETNTQGRDQWIHDVQAMHLLGIKSKTTLQKLRDEGKIRFSQPQKKVIRYDRYSILDYLEQHARNTF